MISSGAGPSVSGLDEDAPDDETADEPLDADEVAERERQALAAEERADIEHLLARVRMLPADSKCERLLEVLADLRDDGYHQGMVFTQYTDTMDFLRDQLGTGGSRRLMCFSGRGGEISSADGTWRVIDRDEAKRRFRDREADILLCTDAAAEGLNFQFCGAVINYDMPWNPMRVEQRIGRIDRVGQTHATIRIVNLHYDGTVETDVYRALRTRIGLFETVVGRLQPILAELPQAIARAVLPESTPAGDSSADLIAAIERRASEAEAGGRLRHRRRTERRSHYPGAAPIADHHGRPRPGDRLSRPDAPGHRDTATRTPRIRPVGAGHDGAGPRHHRPRLLRGAPRERRAVDPRQSPVQARGLPAAR